MLDHANTNIGTGAASGRSDAGCEISSLQCGGGDGGTNTNDSAPAAQFLQSSPPLQKEPSMQVEEVKLGIATATSAAAAADDDEEQDTTNTKNIAEALIEIK